MCSHARLGILLMCLFIGLPRTSLASGPAPFLRDQDDRVSPPIEVVFHSLRPGMTEADVRLLMAPFREFHTEHGQWPSWTDGRFRVHLTLDISKFFQSGDPIRLVTGVLARKEVAGKETRWVWVAGLPDE